MHFEMVVKKRRMCREYLGSDVPQEKLDRVLDMASRYPPADHTEPQELIEERGCEFLYKPSYSPDLNPIEEAFSKIKGLIRKAEARTREALVEAMGMAILAVTAQGARGFFEHSGYRLQIQSL